MARHPKRSEGSPSLLPAIRAAAATLLLLGVSASGLTAQSEDDAASQSLPINEWLFMGDAFEGTFIELADENRGWSQERWVEELELLRSIGFETVLIHWTEYDDFGFVDAGNGGRRTLELMADAADSCGIELFVGLSIRSQWWKIEKVDFRFLLEELSRTTQTADRLYPLFKGHASFKGWYVPHEVTDLHFSDQQWELVIEFYRQVTGHLRRLDPLKPVAAAGFSDPAEATLPRFGFRFAEFLSRSGVDVFIFQDGAGRSEYRDWRKIIPLYEALAAMDDEFEGDIWVLAEIFTQVAGPPLSDGPFKAVPAPIDRVMEQLKALSPLHKKMIVYDYFNYMRPSKGEAEAVLFKAYHDRLEELLRNRSSDWSRATSERQPY